MAGNIDPKQNKYFKNTLKSDTRVTNGEWTNDKVFDIIKRLNLTEDYEGLNLYERNIRTNDKNEPTYKHFEIKFKTDEAYNIFLHAGYTHNNKTIRPQPDKNTFSRPQQRAYFIQIATVPLGADETDIQEMTTNLLKDLTIKYKILQIRNIHHSYKIPPKNIKTGIWEIHIETEKPLIPSQNKIPPITNFFNRPTPIRVLTKAQDENEITFMPTQYKNMTFTNLDQYITKNQIINYIKTSLSDEDLTKIHRYITRDHIDIEFNEMPNSHYVQAKLTLDKRLYYRINADQLTQLLQEHRDQPNPPAHLPQSMKQPDKNDKTTEQQQKENLNTNNKHPDAANHKETEGIHFQTSIAVAVDSDNFPALNSVNNKAKTQFPPTPSPPPANTAQQPLNNQPKLIRELSNATRDDIKNRDLGSQELQEMKQMTDEKKTETGEEKKDTDEKKTDKQTEATAPGRGVDLKCAHPSISGTEAEDQHKNQPNVNQSNSQQENQPANQSNNQTSQTPAPLNFVHSGELEMDLHLANKSYSTATTHQPTKIPVPAIPATNILNKEELQKTKDDKNKQKVNEKEKQHKISTKKRKSAASDEETKTSNKKPDEKKMKFQDKNILTITIGNKNYNIQDTLLTAIRETEKLTRKLDYDNNEDRLALALLIIGHQANEPLYRDYPQQHPKNVKELQTYRAALLREEFGPLTMDNKKQNTIKELPKDLKRQWETENGKTTQAGREERKTKIKQLMKIINDNTSTSNIPLPPPLPLTQDFDAVPQAPRSPCTQDIDMQYEEEEDVDSDNLIIDEHKNNDNNPNKDST